MRSETVRVSGLRETVRALDKVNRDAKKTMLAALAATAEPIASDARERLGVYQGASVRTIRPRASIRGVFVTQGARKVTGLRPDFGALQMTKGLIPALEDHEGQIGREVELAFDVLITKNGF